MICPSPPQGGSIISFDVKSLTSMVVTIDDDDEDLVVVTHRGVSSLRKLIGDHVHPVASPLPPTTHIRDGQFVVSCSCPIPITFDPRMRRVV